MKGNIIVGSIFVVMLIALVPSTSAIEFQAANQALSRTMSSWLQLQDIDAKDLIAILQSLTQDYPELSVPFFAMVKEIQNTPMNGDNPQPCQGDENQTLLEKIFWKIYNYRIIRLIISLFLFLKFQSKFTLLRTTTWGIRLLRWVKIGILLGYIDPALLPQQTPDIGFQQDLVNKTLIVTHTPADVRWSDITEIGDGSCDPLPEGDVLVGDTLTNCTGIIALFYAPTYEVIGVFEFD